MILLMQVAMAFGAIALLLAILGTYGLLAYEMSLREKEIGIPLALLLHEEGRWIAAGALSGSACAIATGDALRSTFYEAHSTSLPVLLGSALLLIAPAFLAIALPVRRVAHQDLVQTLRRE
jgi:hypothetical protein